MKKMALCLAVTALATAEVFAFQATDAASVKLLDGQDISVSVQGSAGYLSGTANERVYDGDYKVSELNWDLKDIYMGGGVVSVGFAKRVHLNFGYWGAMSSGNGQMEDFDWLYEGEDWSDWSLSDVEVTEGYMWDANVTVDVFQKNALNLGVTAGYKNDFWSWKDYGIEHVYSYNSFRDDVGDDPYTTGIEYEQEFQIYYTGVQASYTLSDFKFLMYGTLSPFVTANDKDLHVYRDLEFTEEFSGGTYYGLGAKATYSFKSNVSVSLGIDYQAIPEIIGDTTVTDLTTGETEDYPDSAGIENQVMMVSLGLGYGF